MSRWVDVGAAEDVADGAMKAVPVEERELLLARVGAVYYAADELCPHMGSHLSRGTLEGTVVTCPWHHSQFDLADGRVLRWTDWAGPKQALAKALKAPKVLKTYPARLEGDRLLIDLEGS
jgi:3-phenylpropionate/trans-cinnamate dioxygenase ferredoxin subunit